MLAVLSPWWEHLKTNSCTAFSPLLLRGVPVGVVYAGNNVIFKTRWFPPRSRTDSNARHTVRSRNAFDDENARPVPYSQVVFPVHSSFPCTHFSLSLYSIVSFMSGCIACRHDYNCRPKEPRSPNVTIAQT